MINPKIIITLYALIWILFLYFSTFLHLEKIYVIVTGIYLIFSNLGKRKNGELSAYSVFN